MKLSVSLSEEDVAFLDAYAQELAGAYEDVWQSWTNSREVEIWDSVTADGLEA